MQVKAFRIQNFRSIIDTGWMELASDDITVIVGQNEAGKSTVLDGIYAFENSNVNEDDLRSDNTMPSISISYAGYKPTELSELFPQISKSILNQITRVNLIRTWERGEDGEIINTLDIEERPIKSLFPIKYTQDGQEQELSSDNFAFTYFIKTPPISIFSEETSILPATIDIKDLTDEKSTAKGKIAVENFLKISGLSIETLQSGNKRVINRHLAESNALITSEFQKFWKQKIGTDSIIEFQCDLENHSSTAGNLAGTPYLTFWLKDSSESLYPKQRSKGVLWFLSFFLELYSENPDDYLGKPLILIDEPGASLHARAQESVLAVLESIKDKVCTIYSTHSPYLVKIEHLYRVIAAQREVNSSGYAASVLIPSHRLGQANIDTLLPVYTAMGLDIHQYSAIPKNGNIILEEISAFYYIKSFEKLLDSPMGVSFLPAQGVTNVPTLAYLLLGWGLQFAVAVDDDTAGRRVYNILKSSLFADIDKQSAGKLLKLPTGSGVENVFSTADFTEIICKGVDLRPDGENSERVKDKPKALIAANFKSRIDSGDIKLQDLSESTIENAKRLLHAISTLNK